MHIVRREIRQHLRPIRRLPPEQPERQLIRIVPMHLLRHKIIHPRPLVDLRQLPVIPKRIRIPPNPRRNAILLLEVSLPHQQLPHQRLAARKIQVRLHPHSTDNLPSTFFNPLLDLRIQIRILIRHPLAVLRRGLCKGIVRIFIHQLQRSRKRPPHRIDRLGSRPQPRSINVRIAIQINLRLLQHSVQWRQNLLRLMQRRIKRTLVRGLQSIRINGRHCGFHNRQQIPSRCRQRRQHIRGRKALDAYIIRIWPCIRRRISTRLNAQRHTFKGLVVHRVQQFDSDQHLVARLGGLKQNDGLEIISQRNPPSIEVDDLRHRAIRGGVKLKP